MGMRCIAGVTMKRATDLVQQPAARNPHDRNPWSRRWSLDAGRWSPTALCSGCEVGGGLSTAIDRDQLAGEQRGLASVEKGGVAPGVGGAPPMTLHRATRQPSRFNRIRDKRGTRYLAARSTERHIGRNNPDRSREYSKK